MPNTANGITYPDASMILANLDLELKALADSIEAAAMVGVRADINTNVNVTSGTIRAVRFGQAVHLDINVGFASLATAGSLTIATLPAAWRPAVLKRLPISLGGGGGRVGTVDIDTTGVLTITNQTGVARVGALGTVQYFLGV